MFICPLPPVHPLQYLNTLGELDGFIHSHHCDVVIVGDFDRCNHVTSLLCNLCSCDLCFRDDVMFTYE